MTIFDDSGVPRSDLFRRAVELSDKFTLEADKLNREWHKLLADGGSIPDVVDLRSLELIWRKAVAMTLEWGVDEAQKELDTTLGSEKEILTNLERETESLQ